MKKLITMFLCLLSYQSTANEISGSMDCKVIDQTIVSLSDGRTKTYEFFTDEFKVGDQLKFTYNAQNILEWPPKFEMELIDPIRKEPNGRQQKVGSFFSGKLENILIGTLLSAALSKTDIKIAISEEAISAQNRFSSLILKRYYKNDWEGQFVMRHYLDMTATQIVSLDCRHTDDRLTNLIEQSEKQIRKAQIAERNRKSKVED